jgi:hypothetical protein
MGIALYFIWKARKAMPKVFGNESHDGKTEHVFAMGVVFGTDGQWAALEMVWKEGLAGRVFHAADCETGRGEFALIEHHDNLKLYTHLTTSLCKSELRGFGAAMDLAGPREFFSDVPSEGSVLQMF